MSAGARAGAGAKAWTRSQPDAGDGRNVVDTAATTAWRPKAVRMPSEGSPVYGISGPVNMDPPSEADMAQTEALLEAMRYVRVCGLGLVRSIRGVAAYHAGLCWGRPPLAHTGPGLVGAGAATRCGRH